MLFWDIETEGLPEDELKKIMPEFDPASVKLGNLKDKDKIKAKIDAAREAHLENYVSKAALSAVTGRVLAIGYCRSESMKVVIDGMSTRGDRGQEAAIIERFWKKAESCRADRTAMVGLNIHDFDLPFLMRRSWILDVSVPDWVITNDRYYDGMFVDIRKRWLCGQNPTGGTKSSFDELARAFGTSGKTEGVSGADFAKLWWEDMDKAVEYLTNDVRQPVKWSEQMGIV